MNLKSKRILVTGGHGFLGTNLVRDLHFVDYHNLYVPTSKEYDLTKLTNIRSIFKKCSPEVVIHLAGRVGGIQDNLNAPGEFFYDNLIMGCQLLDEARKSKVEKFITIGSACVYPDNISIPFKEDDLWLGYPSKDTAPYGMAKKVLLVQSQAYRKQYNLNTVFLILANMYGEYDNSSHVIPMLISKCLDAVAYNKKEIVLWGSGEVTRDFLYVRNATRAIISALENYNSSEPLNIGSGHETSIKEVIELIAKLTNYKGKISYDTSKPTGQLRRCLDITKAQKELKFVNKISLKDGINNTIKYLCAGVVR
jgi:GDP-L-fucose synthase